jgi:hypothetical protein
MLRTIWKIDLVSNIILLIRKSAQILLKSADNRDIREGGGGVLVRNISLIKIQI